MKYAIYMVIMTVLFSMSAFGQCSDADRNALIKFDQDWSTANASGDRNAITSFYADQFTAFPAMTDRSAAIEGAIAAAARNKANPELVDKTTADHYMFNCTPLTATVTHRNVTVRAGGKGEPVYGRSVHFLEKRNGKWVAVSNAGGPLSDSDVLRYMELDWIAAVKSHNFDWFEKNLASDFTEVSFITGDIATKRQAIDGMRADKTVFDVMETTDLNIRVDGNTAIVTGIGYGRGKMGDGKPFDMKLRFTDTFIKRDGRWQAWASQATAIPAPGVTAKN